MLHVRFVWSDRLIFNDFVFLTSGPRTCFLDVRTWAQNNPQAGRQEESKDI